MKFKFFIIMIAILSACLIVISSCDDDETTVPTPTPAATTLPTELPFDITRTDVGTPLSDQEIADFTKAITGAWKNADFWKYLEAVTYGYPRDNEDELPYYSSFWSSVKPVKSGDTITFVHQEGGSAENIMIPNPVLLMNTVALYSATQDEDIGLLIEELSRGITATMKGSVWDDNVAEEDRYVMARSIINNNFESTNRSGNKYAVDYSAWRDIDDVRWNTEFVHIPDNPYWGDIWIQNKRSKDDVCHLFRAAGLMPHFSDIFADETVSEGFNEALTYLSGFAEDIVNAEYWIRTVDHDGTIYIPEGQDLASFTMYGDEAECNARITSALLGKGDTQGIDCDDGICTWYELAAATGHIWNYDIIRNFHMAAILQTMNKGLNDLALDLMNGLVARLDDEMEKYNTNYWDDEHDNFTRNLASDMIKYATVGIPLTSEEVRLLHEQFEIGIDYWNSWEYWDLWDESVPDGDCSYKPSSNVDFHDMTSFLQYCASPFKNDNGSPIVDCDIIMDTSQWG